MLGRIRKCLDLLTPRERWRWAALIPLAIVAAALEAIGAAAVLALIQLVSDPAHAATLPVISTVAHGNERRAVLLATIAVGLFYIFKSLALTVITFVQSRVISDSVVAVSRRMLQSYLAAPFAYHLQRNSAELIRNSTFSVQTAFGQVMEPAVAAITEAGIAAAIILVLLVKAPGLTLIAVGVLCAVLAVLLRLTRHTLARWGREEQELRGTVLQTLRQAFDGLKEIKIRGREQFYYEDFSRRQHALARLQHLSASLATALRLLIETVFIWGVLLVIVLVTVRSHSGADIIPLLGLYAYAGFRVIPSVNRILMHLGRIQYGSAAVDALHADLRALPAPSGAAGHLVESAITFRDRLVLHSVSFAYGTHATALRDITFTVARGESIGIVGPTGAGKSTLIDLILGLLHPVAGQITADGADIFAALRAWQSKLGYVPQTVYLIDDSLRRNVAFALPDADIDEEKLRVALQLAQLDNVVRALPNGLDTVVGERGARLSGGERQRVAIARALYHQPEVLVFDEATAALDSQTEHELTSAIESLHGQKTLIIIAHRLSTVRSCDRLLFLRNGRIEAEGPFDQLLERNAQFRAFAAVADHGGP